jgi:hypothetical protein
VTFNLANYVVRPGLNGHWATTFWTLYSHEEG